MRHFLNSLYLFALVALLSACGSNSRGVVHPAYTTATGQPTISSTLWAIGVYGIWCGSIIATVCMLAGVALSLGLISVAAPLAAKLRTYVVDGALVGVCLLLLGCVFAYLGEHIWLVGLSIGLVLVALALRYRTTLKTDLSAIEKGG